MSTPAIRLIPALSDNYIYLLTWGVEGLVVDPAESAPVQAKVESLGIKLTTILITHHHADHVGGVEALKERYGCQVIGPNDSRVPCLDRGVSDGQPLMIGPHEVRVMETPGHTRSHVVYYFPDLKVLFSGDTLFTGGCGRLFEGTAEQMWLSLTKIASLPGDTRVYCGHEYTVTNLSFALDVEPGNQEVATRLAKARSLRADGRPTIPSTLAEERATNPFLRAHDRGLRAALHMDKASEIEVFAHLRALKDVF